MPLLRNCARIAALGLGLWLGGHCAAVLAQTEAGQVVATDVDAANDCRLEVSEHGSYYRLTARGLEPGEPARLVLVNTDLPPIDRVISARPDGLWTQVYIPALPGHQPGPVQASLSGERCTLSVSFTWRRPSRIVEPIPDWAASHFAGY